MAGHGSKIGRKQEAAIHALLTQRNTEEAARVAGISKRTLIRWQKIPAFQAAHLEARHASIPKATRGCSMVTGPLYRRCSRSWWIRTHRHRSACGRRTVLWIVGNRASKPRILAIGSPLWSRMRNSGDEGDCERLRRIEEQTKTRRTRATDSYSLCSAEDISAT